MAKRGQGEGTISKRPDGTWWARITVGRDAEGKQKRKAFYGKTRKEVQEKLTAAVNEVNTGTYIEPTVMTFGQWLDIWMRTYKKDFIRSSTYAMYGKVCKAIKQRIGEVKMKDLQTSTVQDCINDLNTVWSQSTVSRALTITKGALAQAVDDELIKSNVAVKCKVPLGKVKQSRAMTAAEQEIFVQKIRTTYHSEIYLVALATGMRIGEARALTWDDIDFEKRLIRVNKTASDYYDREAKKQVISVGNPKTKAGNRTIPILQNTVLLLGEVRRSQEDMKIKAGKDFNPQNLVFCTYTGNLLEYAHLNKAFRRVVNDMGVPELHIHCLRHTYATRCLESGIELRVVQELLGHSNINMTANIYTHVLSDKKHDSVQKLINVIDF